MQIAVLGIDLGKNSCSLVGLDKAGSVIKRRRLRPETLDRLRAMGVVTVSYMIDNPFGPRRDPGWWPWPAARRPTAQPGSASCT